MKRTTGPSPDSTQSILRPLMLSKFPFYYVLAMLTPHAGTLNGAAMGRGRIDCGRAIF